jgi:hypothetical protein
MPPQSPPKSIIEQLGGKRGSQIGSASARPHSLETAMRSTVDGAGEARADFVRVMMSEDPIEISEWITEQMPKQPEVGIVVAVSKLARCNDPSLRVWIIKILGSIGPVLPEHAVTVLLGEYKNAKSVEAKQLLRKAFAALLGGIDRQQADVLASPPAEARMASTEDSTPRKPKPRKSDKPGSQRHRKTEATKSGKSISR